MVSRRPKLSATIKIFPLNWLIKSLSLCNCCSARRSISTAGKVVGVLLMVNESLAKGWVALKKSSVLISSVSSVSKGRSAS